MEKMEKQHETMESLEERLGKAESWEELEEILGEYKSFEGSKKDSKSKIYSMEDVMNRLQAVKEGAKINLLPGAGGLREKVSELLIKDTESWDDLLKVMDQIMVIRGEDIDKHKKSIENAQQGLDPKFVTRTYGLRQKVMELQGR